MMNTLDRPQAYLVGGGIASLSAAVLLIRDAGLMRPDSFEISRTILNLGVPVTNALRCAAMTGPQAQVPS